jgi:hypothetical protein
MEWRDLEVNQVEEKVALCLDQAQRSSQSFSKFDDYSPASKVEETNSERNEENSEKTVSPTPN